MPSLKALEEFQASFREIGGEPLVLAGQNLSPENIPLPEREAVVPSPPASPGSGEEPETAPAGDPLPGGPDGGDASTDESGGEDTSGDFDLSAFLDAGTDALSTPVPGIPDIPDIPGEFPGEEGFPPLEDAEPPDGGGETEPEEDAFNLPEDLLNGLADDLESTDEEAAPSGEGGDILPDDLELPDTPAGDLSDFALDGPDAGEIPAPDNSFSPGGPEDAPEPGPESAGQEQPPPDPFENFDPGTAEDAADSSGPDDTGNTGGGDSADTEDGGMDDFSLPGLDDVLKRAIPGETAAPAARPVPEEAPGDDIEEIQLSDEELEELKKTLSAYPLNLRIICEELIAEQAVVPDLMSRLIKLLVQGAPARETAALAGKILDRPVAIPRGFEKKTGEALEVEQSSFAYIFIHNFLPVLRLFLMIAVTGASAFYLAWQFIYIPLKADSIYKIGYERIGAGDYGRANERFREAFRIHRVKDWFYKYAEAFRDERQYTLAEEMYNNLLNVYPRDKKGVLDYADLLTYYKPNYRKADELLRREILDYKVDDPEALLALGDTNMVWGAEDPSRYEDAREAYAKLMERNGRTDPLLERMLKYFIRTDNLEEVLSLQSHFMASSKRKISPAALSELGGYLLDKRFEDTRSIPHEYQSQIDGIRDILLRAVRADPSYPESHYHLARYYNHWGNTQDERLTLEQAITAFDAAGEETVQRLKYRIDAHHRYSRLLTNNREFVEAWQELIKGITLYEDALNRQDLPRTAEFGRLYADLGDLEYFSKDGNMETVLMYYHRSELNGWAPPEIQYRMGSAHYHLEQWTPAVERFFSASREMPLNRRLLFALGNTLYMRGDYFAAQGYYSRLLDILETERIRFPLLNPQDQRENIELTTRLMAARNNMGVALEVLSNRTGIPSFRSQALGLYAESARAWDALSRNPETMIRPWVGALSAPGIANLPYLNSRNAVYPETGYEPQIFMFIDKDALEPSPWEKLVPDGGILFSDNFSPSLNSPRGAP